MGQDRQRAIEIAPEWRASASERAGRPSAWTRSWRRMPGQLPRLNMDRRCLPLRGLFVLLLTLALLALNACGGRPTPASDLRIELRAGEGSVRTGETTLTVRVADAAGQPVEDAAVSIEGNMIHAGMTPVFAAATGGQDGLYTAPFTWTMGGDWVVTVKVTLPDGRQAQTDFPVGVTEP